MNAIDWMNAKQHEPLADAYLLSMSHDQLRELATTIGTSPDYFIRRAHHARQQRHYQQLGIWCESAK